MRRHLIAIAAVTSLIALCGGPALAQKAGGVLHAGHFDSPASMSMREDVDTTQWYPRLMRKDFKVGLNFTESEVDDPDAQFYENYVCGALRNYTGYCNKSVDELVDRQSRETDASKRRQLVWQIEKTLNLENARPDILYVRGTTCRQP